jgi:serine/threonine protein kinase
VSLGRQLGEGGFAFVYLCSDVYDVAVKYCLKKIIIQV